MYTTAYLESRMTPDELSKYNLIKAIVDGVISRERGRVILGNPKKLPAKKLDELISIYKEKGMAGFATTVLKNSPTPEELALQKKIVDCYKGDYRDMSAIYFSKMLLEHENIKISDRKATQILNMHFIFTPAQRAGEVGKTHKVNLETKLSSCTDPQIIEEINYGLSLFRNTKTHFLEPKKTELGAEIQMDASKAYFIDDQIWCLHVAIDCASGWIVGAWFDIEETLSGYMHITEQMLSNYGVPRRILTDNREVFRNNKKESKKTQFGWACKNLGIDLVTTSVPETKGGVEERNNVLQMHLPGEFRVNKIRTIDEANAFLANYYISKYNSEKIVSDSIPNLFEPISADEINCSLAVFDIRSAKPGHVLQTDKKMYYLIDAHCKRLPIPTGKKVLFLIAFDGKMYGLFNGNVYAMIDKELYPKITPHELSHIPNSRYLWTINNYNRYIEKIVAKQKAKKKS